MKYCEECWEVGVEPSRTKLDYVNMMGLTPIYTHGKQLICLGHAAKLKYTNAITVLRLPCDLHKFMLLRCLCSGKKNSDKTDMDTEVPEPPTTCCNSGCDSCVWIEYAEELCKKLKNGGDIARATILEKVKDPSMKAFLLAELKDLEKDNDK